MSTGRIVRFLADRKDFKNILVSGTGSLLSPLVNFIALPVVLRAYDPHDYGLWALLMSFVLLPGNVSTLRYELAIVLTEDDHQAGKVIGLSTVAVWLFGLVAVLATGLRRYWLPIFPPLAHAGGEVWAVPALIVIVGLVLITRTYCTRVGAFHFNALSLIALAVGTNGFQILAPRLNLPGVTGLILGSVVGWGASLLILLVGYLKNMNRQVWAGIWSRDYGGLLRKYRNFPRYSVPYSFVGTLRIEGIKLLLGIYGNASLVGDIAFAQRLMNFPVTVFCGGIRPVLYQKASLAESSPSVEPFVTRIMVGLILLLTPLMVAFEYVAPQTFHLMAGGGWQNSVPYARILLVPSFFLLLTGWLDRLLDVAGRQDVALKYEVGFSLLSLVAFWLGLAVFDDTLLAVGLQSLASLVYYVVLTVVIYRIVGFPLDRLAFPGFLVLGMTAMMGLVSWPMLGMLGPFAGLAPGLVVSYGIFVVLAWRKNRADAAQSAGALRSTSATPRTPGS